MMELISNIFPKISMMLGALVIVCLLCGSALAAVRWTFYKWERLIRMHDGIMILFQLCFFRSVIGLTIHQWRSLRRNRRCRYCAHSRVFHGRDGDLYFCEAKGKLVYEGLPRWFCQVYTVEEDF